MPVVVGVLEAPDAHRVVAAAGSPVVLPQLRGDRVAERLAREDQLALAVLQAAVERLDRLAAAARSGRCRSSAPAAQASFEKSNVHARGLFRKPSLSVSHAFITAVVHQLRLVRRDRLLRVARQLDAARDAGRVHLDVAVGERAGDDAVEVVRDSAAPPSPPWRPPVEQPLK